MRTPLGTAQSLVLTSGPPSSLGWKGVAHPQSLILISLKTHSIISLPLGSPNTPSPQGGGRGNLGAPAPSGTKCLAQQGRILIKAILMSEVDLGLTAFYVVSHYPERGASQ